MTSKASLHGVLVLDKPQGLTSFAALRVAQRALGTRDGGHAGTLDPMATGVLVALIGEATKLSALLMEHDKDYLAEVTLGVETDTLDALGEAVETRPVPTLAEDDIRDALPAFVGEHLQVPPRFSALKKEGRTHMSRARAGEDFEVESRPAICHSLELVSLEGLRLTLACRVGKGYYVRSLARDLARALGTVGHLSALRRTRVGAFGIDRAVAPERARPDDLIPLSQCVAGLPRLVTSPRLAADLSCGRPTSSPAEALPASHSGQALALHPDGRALALVDATPDPAGGHRLRVVRGFNLAPAG